jgi:hypothetical protein
MSTATTTEPTPGQSQSRRVVANPTNTPTSQLERSAAQRLRTTMAAVKLSFTWLGVRKTLAPEQRTTAARAFHADRELLSASKLILDTKNPAYRAVAAVRCEASSYWRIVTLPFPEAGIRLLPQNSLGMFASTMQTYRERLQEAARQLSSQYDTIKSEAQRRTLTATFATSDHPSDNGTHGLHGFMATCVQGHTLLHQGLQEGYRRLLSMQGHCHLAQSLRHQNYSGTRILGVKIGVKELVFGSIVKNGAERGSIGAPP